MIDSSDLKLCALEIGGRIDAFIKADQRSQAEIAAELGVKEDTLKKIRAGKSNLQYAKLAQLAVVLRTTPNRILGFEGGADRELLKGALEGTYAALGHPVAEAEEFALVFLGMLDTPEGGGPVAPADKGRVLAEFLIRQFVDLKRR